MESFKDEMSRIDQIVLENAAGQTINALETHNFSESGNLLVLSIIGIGNVPPEKAILGLKSKGIISSDDEWTLDEDKTESWSNMNQNQRQNKSYFVFRKNGF